MAWWGLRGYSAAYAAGNSVATSPAIDICTVSSGNVTTIEILTAGGLNLSRIASWQASFGPDIYTIKAWDQTGGGRHQIFGNPAPLILNAYGSLPCIRMNGTSQNGSTTGGAFTRAQPFSFSSVVNVASSPAANATVLGNAGGTVRTGYRNLVPSVYTVAGGSEIGPTGLGFGLHAIQSIFNGNNTPSGTYVDGTMTQGNVGTGGLSADDLGFDFPGDWLESGGWPLAFTNGGAGNNTFDLNANQHAYYGP
jgi:hypothetical protein